MNKIILKFFKKFQGRKLSTQDLTSAIKKAMNLGAHADDLLLIVNLIKDTKNKKYKLEKKYILILTGAIIYVVSPVDAVSDVIPGLGWLDDGTLIAYVARSYSDILRDYKEFCKNQK
ncbi:DUF1232 domain-containing protein [Cetobacterium sp. 8H]|uniref:YkvA family protein n=1 Tax=Cetobacterium sp. 8H TaxID=2759681 RepID=UPI00163CCBF7|nr:DUF1232 domain-containing protein [Cetobacterium sp. 8H]MBC2851849.1 DUF1232 domain-containing protein [Cetobacterium sp. 8H]